MVKKSLTVTIDEEILNSIEEYIKIIKDKIGITPTKSEIVENALMEYLSKKFKEIKQD
ncbi:MAG: hypothetical protein ACE5K4_00080 [Candidatus Hydrothermarchaeota archaeon]